MIIRQVDCQQCIWDKQAVDQWRIAGGEMPRRLCPTDHRPQCIKCDTRMYEVRKSAICDTCWAAKMDGIRKSREKLKERANAIRSKGAVENAKGLHPAK